MRSPSIGPVTVVVLSFVGGLLGIVIGVIVGGALYSGPTDFLDTNIGNWWFGGGVTGLIVGALALPAFVCWLDSLGDGRRQAER